jgi:hypothetical protein
MATAKRAAPAPLSKREIESLVLHAVGRSSIVSYAELKRALPGPHRGQESEVLGVARALVDRGELHRWAIAKSEWFFAVDPIATLEKCVRAALAAGPLGSDALARRVTAESAIPKKCFDEWKKGALARHTIFEVAAPGTETKKSKLLALEPDLRASLKTAIAAVRKSLKDLESKGIARERAASVLWEELGLEGPSPLSAAQDREVFLRELRAFASEHPSGTLLPVGDLRGRLAIDKARFDHAALSLSREGAVVLHHHDHPAGLAAEERNKLVRDPRGAYYLGIALKSS